MPPPFQTPRAELLTADGRFEPVGDGGGFGPRRVLLARELCAFERFERPGTSRTSALAAARLYARTAGPFHDPGVLIRGAGAGLGIWWWDREVVGPLMQARFSGTRVACAPETLAQPKGEGWRMVKGASGYEAQFWRGGELMASSFRREPFSAQDWAAFARVQRDAADTAPAAPPPAQALPLYPQAAFRFGGLPDLTQGEMAALAAGVAALAVLGFVAFEIGQGVRYLDRAKAAERKAAETPVVAATPAADRRDMERLRGYQSLAGRPRPLESLGVALEVLRRNGVEPQAFEADGQGLTLVLPYAAIGKTEQLATELSATGAFAEVRPATQAARKAVEIRLVPKGASPAG